MKTKTSNEESRSNEEKRRNNDSKTDGMGALWVKWTWYLLRNLFFLFLSLSIHCKTLGFKKNVHYQVGFTNSAIAFWFRPFRPCHVIIFLLRGLELLLVHPTHLDRRSVRTGTKVNAEMQCAVKFTASYPFQVHLAVWNWFNSANKVGIN